MCLQEIIEGFIYHRCSNCVCPISKIVAFRVSPMIGYVFLGNNKDNARPIHSLQVNVLKILHFSFSVRNATWGKCLLFAQLQICTKIMIDG